MASCVEGLELYASLGYHYLVTVHQGIVPALKMVWAQRSPKAKTDGEKGDANRSARVRRPFHFIENNRPLDAPASQPRGAPRRPGHN